MELSDRKKAILHAVIKHFIETGEPVGSKALCNMLDFNVSSATLRNEMSDLCEIGFLEQPHTSAGRLPTNDGYSFYLNNLVGNISISPQMKNTIDNLLNEASKDPEHLTNIAGQILSDLTGLPSFLATVSNKDAYVYKIEVLPMGRNIVFLLLLTSDKIAKSMVCRCSYGVTPELLELFDRLMKQFVIGTKLENLTPALLQSVVAKAGIEAISLTPLISTVFELVEDIRLNTVDVKGEMNAVHCYNNDFETKEILHFLSHRDKLFDVIFSDFGNNFIIFGDKTGIEELKPSNLIVSSYSIGGKEIGKVGIIGPTRMAYEQMIPSVQYFALKLGDIITNSMNDLEDFG